MDWLKKALKKVKKSFGRKGTGKSKQKCPLAETGLLVVVVREDNRRVVKEAIVDIQGKTPFNKKTGNDGLALFKPLEPDTYTIRVTLPGHMTDDFEEPEQEQETVSLGSCPIHVIKVLPLSTLKIRVLRMEGDKEKFLEGVKIHIKGRDERDGQTPEVKDGWVIFEKIKSGDYEISITSLGTYAKVYKIPATSGTRISSGETKEVIFYVKKATLNIKVVDKNDESRFIPKVKVKIDVLAQGNALPEKTTTENEPVVHDPVEPGKYSATISFSKEDEERYRIPEDEQKTKEISIQSGSTYELVFRVIPIFRVYLKLQFKDPESKDRIFPEKMPLQLVFDGDEHLDAVVGKDGLVYDKEGDDAKPYMEVERRRKWFKLAFKQPKRAFVVCEEKGKEETQEYLQEEDPFKADTDLRKAINQGKRVFQLPHGDFTWDNADWEISGANTFKDHKVDKIDDIKTEVGKKGSPVTLSLDLHWQFIRFEYFDRYYGHSDHNNEKISILPVPLEGYGENVKSQETPPVDKLITFSNWTIGDEDTKLVQCLPWIVRRKNDNKSLGYPNYGSMLRFQTDDDHRFIKSTAKDSREFTKLDDTNPDGHHLPCADRLRYYDLPKEWRSTRYFCRLSDNADDQDFFEAVYYRGFDKDYPLIFSLDDMILTDNNLNPVVWTYNDPEDANNPNDRLALFINTFQGSGWNVPEPPVPAAGAGAPPPAPLPPYPPTHSAHKKPAPPPIPPRSMALPAKPAGPSLSTWYSPDGLYRHDLKNKAHDYSRITVKSSYVADYPNWCRLVVAKGNLHDVSDQRTKHNNADPNHLVGVRAAVRWVESAIDAHKPGTVVDPRPGITKYPNTAEPFFAMQPLYEQKFCHPYTKVGDQESGIGRFDKALLRCCDVDKSDDNKEVAVCLMYMRVCYNFVANPVGMTKEAFGNQLAKNVCDRWNGRDAHGGETSFLPTDGAKKLKVKLLYFMQNTVEKRSHIKFEIRAPGDPNARQFVNSREGLGMLKTDDYQPTGAHGHADTFTAAHEYGHFGSQPDDYGERWSNCSYDQLDYTNLVPGIPFVYDKQAIMRTNLKLRGRKFWFAAEWVRHVSGVDFKLKHRNDDKFLLPQHPNAPSKTYAGWPYNVQYGIDVAARSKFDTYLYRLGEDATANDVYPNAAGCAGQVFDGILVVAVKTKWKLYTTTDAKIRDALRVVDQHISSKCNNKFYATGKITVDTKEYTFTRCLIQFQLRFIVETFSGTANWPSFKDDPGAPGPGKETGAQKYAQHLVNIEAWTGGTHFNVDLKDRTSPTQISTWGGAAPNRALTLRCRLTTPGWQNLMRNQFYPKFRVMLGLADNNNALAANDIKPIVEKVLTNVNVANTKP